MRMRVAIGVFMLTLVAAPLSAAPIGFSFSGNADFFSATIPFSGSFTWDPAGPTLSHSDPGFFQQYVADAATFTWNGTDQTAAIFDAYVRVGIQSFYFFMNFSTALPSPRGGVRSYLTVLELPAGTFSDPFPLPENLDFLSAVTGSATTIRIPGDIVGADNLVVTPNPPVPEPGSLFLLGSGMVGLAGVKRLRRRR